MILRVKEQMASAPADVPDCLVKRLLEENMIKGHVFQGKAEEKEGELDWEDACMVSAAFTLGGLHSVSTHLATATLCTNPAYRQLV